MDAAGLDRSSQRVNGGGDRRRRTQVRLRARGPFDRKIDARQMVSPGLRSGIER
jgi:hypothetical protein